MYSINVWRFDSDLVIHKGTLSTAQQRVENDDTRGKVDSGSWVGGEAIHYMNSGSRNSKWCGSQV